VEDSVADQFSKSQGTEHKSNKKDSEIEDLDEAKG